jgi:hypothetical protein
MALQRRRVEAAAPGAAATTGAAAHASSPSAVPRWAQQRCLCSCLPPDLAAAAPITTSEHKFSVSRHVAEWWCTLSSPLFALSLLLYREHGLSDLRLEHHALIWGGVMQGAISAVYHCTTLEIFSLLDVSWALLMFHLTTAVSFGAPPWWCALHASVLLGICFRYRARIASVSIWLVAMLWPFLLYTTAERVRLAEAFYAGRPAAAEAAMHRRCVILASFALGGLSFLADRTGLAASHPMWHVLIGVMLWQSLSELIEIPCAPCMSHGHDQSQAELSINAL